MVMERDVVFVVGCGGYAVTKKRFCVLFVMQT